MKIKCPYCRKKKTHAHKRSSEPNSSKIIIGNMTEYNLKNNAKIDNRKKK